MPDIKSALEAALKNTADAWAADDEAHQQIQLQQEKAMDSSAEKTDGRITNNVSRTTFYFVRDNPGMTADQITKTLMDRGFKATSVSSLIGQMLRMRLVMADDYGRLSTVVKEYIPIKPDRKPKARATTPAPVQERKQVTLVNTRTGEVLNPKPEPKSYHTAPDWTVESVIGHLNVRQAMAVYSELRKIFGE
jgi:hypothetical protein